VREEEEEEQNVGRNTRDDIGNCPRAKCKNTWSAVIRRAARQIEIPREDDSQGHGFERSRSFQAACMRVQKVMYDSRYLYAAWS
jgi:hypothetical protein